MDKRYVLILLLLLVSFIPTEYKIDKVCRGQGMYAAVIEHDNLHYVIRSDKWISYNFEIEEMQGLFTGSTVEMVYWHNKKQYHRRVELLSRARWGYAGQAGAITVCRTAVKPKFNE